MAGGGGPIWTASSANSHDGRVGVGGGVDRDGLDAQLPACARDPQRDLAAVGDQDLLEHAPSPSAVDRRVIRARGTSAPARTRPRSPFSTRISATRPPSLAATSFISFIASTMPTVWPGSTRRPPRRTASRPAAAPGRTCRRAARAPESGMSSRLGSPSAVCDARGAARPRRTARAGTGAADDRLLGACRLLHSPAAGAGLRRPSALDLDLVVAGLTARRCTRPALEPLHQVPRLRPDVDSSFDGLRLVSVIMLLLGSAEVPAARPGRRTARKRS